LTGLASMVYTSKLHSSRSDRKKMVNSVQQTGLFPLLLGVLSKILFGNMVYLNKATYIRAGVTGKKWSIQFNEPDCFRCCLSGSSSAASSSSRTGRRRRCPRRLKRRTWAQCYKTFYGRNLPMFVVS
jgi:hypothetical protein